MEYFHPSEPEVLMDTEPLSNGVKHETADLKYDFDDELYNGFDDDLNLEDFQEVEMPRKDVVRVELKTVCDEGGVLI